MLKTVIFDMDGVTIDSEDLIYEFEQEMFAELGIVVPKEEHLKQVGKTCEGFWGDIKKLYNLPQPVEDLIEESKKREIIMMGKVGLMPGVLDLMDELKKRGVKMVIASSAPLKRIMIAVERFGLDKYFDGIVSGDDVQRGKPDPEVFLIAASKAGTLPAECVVIEDARNGVAAARAAGIRCIGFDRAVGRQDLSAADLLVRDFKELSYERLKELVEGR